MPRPARTALLALAAALLAGALAIGVRVLREPGEEPPAAAARPKIFFDDFAGAGLAARGWTASRPTGVSVTAGRLRLSAAALCHAPKYGRGTSAARVRLGPAGDVAFAVPGAFEFVSQDGVLSVARPQGGTRRLRRRAPGWHVLVARVEGGGISYFVDGDQVATPRGPVRSGAAALALGSFARPPLDVDWVYHHADALLAPAEVGAAVASLRGIGIGYQDTVPAAAAAPTPCAP